MRHRLERYSAGRLMDYETASADAIAAAMVDELTRPVACRRIESDGDMRAAPSL